VIVLLSAPRRAAGLQSFLAERLKPGGVPDEVHAWGSLPREVTGKVLENPSGTGSRAGEPGCFRALMAAGRRGAYAVADWLPVAGAGPESTS
jgi:hypothetical protein